MPEHIREFVVAETLGVTVVELRRWPIETIYEAEGFRQGLELAQWARQHPKQGHQPDG